MSQNNLPETPDATTEQGVNALLLSNINMQPLVPFLKPWKVVNGEFNSLLLDLSNPASPAFSGEFTHILCLHDTDAMLGDAFWRAGAAEQADSYLDALGSFCANNPAKIVIANTFCVSSARWLNFADLLEDKSLRRLEGRFNDRMCELARAHSNLLLIDIELLYRQFGEKALSSNAFWYLGRIRFTNQMFRILADRIHQASRAYANQSRKVLILDLDNTLWGGIVGETGPLGIGLSEEGRDRVYRDFQKAIRALQRTGVLLAVCSKNNPEDFDEVLDRNPMMILRRDDFSCIRANWEPKPQNIASIAETLNLGLDSFVFIDDNPVERELVASTMPAVAVPAFPTRIEDLATWFLQKVVPDCFGKVKITQEDAAKTAQYRANESRRKLAVSMDLETFLRDLNIQCRILVDPMEHAVRIAQMTQKTNQFNLTTRRYQLPQIEHFILSPDHAVLLLEYEDRFGYEGAVALAILDLPQCRIDSFLMSCRVIGRKVEDKLLEAALRIFETKGCSRIIGEYIASPKNQQTATFYKNHGFAIMLEEDGRQLYEKAIHGFS